MDWQIENSTSASHEFAHGLGEPDANINQVGVGQPGITAARGTGVDASYTHDPTKGDSKVKTIDFLGKPTSYTNTVDPTQHKVTQKDIDNLQLGKKLGGLKFDKNGKASTTIGKLTKIYHRQ